MGEVLNFDPNYDLCGNTSKKTVRLTFGLWEYRLTVEKVVGGNCGGLLAIDHAVEQIYDDWCEAGELLLTRADGDTLSCDINEHDAEEDGLKEMLISAEIIAIVPDLPRAAALKSGSAE